MVHTGRPSRGCGLTGQRCDEKSPECSYCVKTKQNCPGYKDMFDLAWRDQNSVAQKNVERRKRASAKRETEEESPSASKSIDKPVNLNLTLDIIPPALKEDPEAYALAFFFSSYASPPVEPDDRRGFLEHIGPQYVIAPPDSALKMATMAISSFLFIAWLDRRPDNPMSRSFYLKAISAMKDRIRQPGGCADNDVLTSVLLLQMYEVSLTRYATDQKVSDRMIPQDLAGIAQKSQLPNAHLHGALALIKHRGAENFTDDVAQSLLFQVRGQLIDDAFRRGQPLSEEVSTWAAHLQGGSLPPSVRLDSINVDLANLEAGARQRAALPPFLKSELDPHDILEKARDIERRLLEWSGTLPLSWLPLRVVDDDSIPPTTKAAGLYQSHCHIYPSMSISGSWNKQRISCIKVQTLIYEQLAQRSPMLEILSSRMTRQNKVQQLADDICVSVPFSLGDKTKPGAMGDRRVQYPHDPGREVPSGHYQMAPAMGGFWLLGPLQMLMGLKIELRQGQKQWVGGRLRRIAHIYNIGK
ncbi:uncharacterized protein PAC_18752 [Phialocephala subalpina]|uniref:Zn(2)-C6 fungal-type domain-containing protein n=1 Tax=Phialocephala subalpina TaxID=576137 RepID=A0A1L7XUY6_9HELO|nr:uncharacterized protein PAC_18752 [Phialocephala subalpina]